jgi:hypothetical protein
MIEECWIEYEDILGRRYYTKYYITEEEAEQNAKNLKEQGYKNISIHTFRY